MFILRIIEEERLNKNEPFKNVITNYELGNSYSVLKNGLTTEYDELMEETYPDFDKNGYNGIICAENKLDFFIEKNTDLRTCAYFIMTETGKTFERL